MNPEDLRLTASFSREGWSARDLDDACEEGSLTRLRRGVYGSAPFGEQLVRHQADAAAAAMLRIPGTVISHTSAAVFHRLPVRQEAHAMVHLTRESGSHGRRQSGVHLHHTPIAASEIETIDGFHVTALERTVADVGRQEPFAWAVVLADAALAREIDHVRLAAYVAGGARRPGNRNLERTLRFADGRAGSPAESLSRVTMMRAGIPTPELQYDVTTADGEWIATSDFAWPEWGLVGEVDGRTKYSVPDRGRTAADVITAEKRREELIRQCGWWVTRWSWEIASDHARLGDHLRQAFRAALGRRAA